MATKNEVLTVSKGFLIASDLLLKGKKKEAANIFAKLASTPSRRRGMVDVVKALADATEKMVNDDEDTRAAKRADLVKALDEARKDYCELLNKYNQEQADAQKDDYKKNVMKCSANDIQRMNLFRNNMIKM